MLERQGQELWCHSLKTTFKDSKKGLKNYKRYIKRQSVSVFPDITEVIDFLWKNSDVSRTQMVFHVIYTFLDLL